MCYPLDSDLSGGKRYPPFEQPEPGVQNIIYTREIIFYFSRAKVRNLGKMFSVSRKSFITANVAIVVYSFVFTFFEGGNRQEKTRHMASEGI